MASSPGWGREGENGIRGIVVAALARYARLTLLAYAAAVGTWSFIAPGPVARASVADASIVAPIIGSAATVTVAVDGLATRIPAAGTVGEALDQLGVVADPGDRVSAARSSAIVPGQRVSVHRGMPVTLLDGGRPAATRSAHGTVRQLLDAAGIVLGPMDTVDRAPEAAVAPGDVIRVTRVAEREIVLREEVAFAVRYVADPELDRGNQRVVTAGRAGSVESRYLIRVVNGEEVARTRLASAVLSEPVVEVRRLGTRSPRAPSEIETIIREAAATYGADPEQLLRVAWCESRYNPSAYNPSGASGLFQFMPRTWAANSVRVGYAGASPFDPVASANVAAWMFARGSSNLWSCK